ncbi:hypothetical protein B0T16DRAFT_499067 [Cercophora newfieldiana]|uniref:Uncharacterized protein n=1 Tax=Cercophora newfieldiana TaxID=92897 RepID=A0AA39YPG7_9PEZI|nr:hypothetical protein B0T16DRAFT_499067 [Cercophora newfieldiana]
MSSAAAPHFTSQVRNGKYMQDWPSGQHWRPSSLVTIALNSAFHDQATEAAVVLLGPLISLTVVKRSTEGLDIVPANLERRYESLQALRHLYIIVRAFPRAACSQNRSWHPPKRFPSKRFPPAELPLNSAPLGEAFARTHTSTEAALI